MRRRNPLYVNSQIGNSRELPKVGRELRDPRPMCSAVVRSLAQSPDVLTPITAISAECTYVYAGERGTRAGRLMHMLDCMDRRREWPMHNQPQRCCCEAHTGACESTCASAMCCRKGMRTCIRARANMTRHACSLSIAAVRSSSEAGCHDFSPDDAGCREAALAHARITRSRNPG
jgi:hypothetical protein